MSNTKINIQLVEENRPSLTTFGPLFGKRIFKAAKESVITDFNQKLEQANHNKGLFLNRNINRYKVQAIDITSLDFEKGIDDEPEIVINKDKVDDAGNSIEIRCSLNNEKFTKDVTVENLTEALTKDGGAGRNVYFSSGKKLAEFLNQQNFKEQSKIEDLIADLKKMAAMIETTSDKNTAYAESYYRQLDGKKDINIHVNVTED